MEVIGLDPSDLAVDGSQHKAPFVRDACALRQLDSVIPKTHKNVGKKLKKKLVVRGERWPLERTNSWLSNFGQLRRNTDRFSIHREAALALAITMIITVKLVKWAKRWNG